MNYKEGLCASKFNFRYKRGDKTVVYNTFTKALVLMDEESLLLLDDDFCTDDKKRDSIIALKENGFLVDSNFDELKYLKYYNTKVRYANNYFSLTIAPTLQCNFDCPYCFENKRTGMMPDAVQNAIIELVKKKIDEGVRTIEITWYGGEPLLSFEVIERMAKDINRICIDNKVRCKMGMISNGYLLDERIVDFLEEYDISYQVTLDGLQKNHDKRRYLKGGQGTYQRIIENLKLFNNRKINVYVRMNVDKENQSDYEKLSSIIDGFENPRMILYPSVTENINERKTERIKNYMSGSSYDDFIAKTRKSGVFKFGSTELPISNDVGRVPNDKCYFCAAELDNSCVIDEKGCVYKCWDEVGKEEYCFNVLEPYKINYNHLYRYMGDHVFDDPKCSKCVFLPICFGGCKFHRYYLNQYACSYTNESLIQYIEDCLLKNRS